MINVHLLASKRNVLNDIDTLRKISNIVTTRKHNIIDDWVEATYDLRVNKNSQGDAVDWASIYTGNLETITKADVIIAETSFDTFGVGYQVAAAVQQKKPVLLLRREDAEVDAFATGIIDSWVQKAVYNDGNLETTIGRFLDENDIAVKDMRFNFFIDRQIYNYLRWSSQKTGKTKAEVLRELVVREIDKNES